MENRAGQMEPERQVAANVIGTARGIRFVILTKNVK
jgi:hypothetical protein